MKWREQQIILVDKTFAFLKQTLNRLRIGQEIVELREWT